MCKEMLGTSTEELGTFICIKLSDVIKSVKKRKLMFIWITGHWTASNCIYIRINHTKDNYYIFDKAEVHMADQLIKVVLNYYILIHMKNFAHI